MKSVEKSGRTVEEAVESALSELGVSREDVLIEVLEEPSRGFLGILGGRDAKVRVTVKKEKVELAKEFVLGLIKKMGLEASIEVRSQGDARILDIIGRDLGLLIGRRGETLKHLEFLTNVVCSKGAGEAKRVLVDVSGYRRRREKELEEIARSTARRVERSGKSIMLEPMDARDRRIIHMALQKNNRVVTHSEGEEPFRRVVISLRRGQGSEPRKEKTEY
ncbi:MAG TPA: protein jag [Firmicutes bacterium]|nr:protein jag [Candidatus Fermentithermobacillaceae bacterium]